MSNAKCCPFKMCLEMEPRELFLLGARIGFGSFLLYVGLMKWVGGPVGFIGYLHSAFSETWVPGLLTTILAWIIMVTEPLIGLWILIGKCPRLSWVAAAKLVLLLTFGKIILKDFATVAHNFQYYFLCLGCAALAKPSCGKTKCCDVEAPQPATESAE